jgi:hypothetical protein
MVARSYLDILEGRGGIIEREAVLPQQVYYLFGDRLLLPTERVVGISFGVRAIDDSVAQLIGHSTDVRDLELSGEELSDEGVRAALKQRSLRSLLIARAGITDASIGTMRQIQSLAELSLVFCDRLTGMSIDRIAGMTQVDALSLRGCSGIEGAAFRKLTALAELKILDLAYTNVVDDDVEFLAAMPALESVDLSYTSVSNEMIESLRRRVVCQIRAISD